MLGKTWMQVQVANLQTVGRDLCSSKLGFALVLPPNNELVVTTV